MIPLLPLFVGEEEMREVEVGIQASTLVTVRTTPIPSYRMRCDWGC
jgi:hypothetical protein